MSIPHLFGQPVGWLKVLKFSCRNMNQFLPNKTKGSGEMSIDFDYLEDHPS